LLRYQAGGGTRGNVPVQRVNQMLSSVPFVDRVNNFLPANGGADAESTQDFLLRAPKVLRHQGYAVTVEDYEDLARLASAEVAHVKVVMLQDLALDPFGHDRHPGTVSLIVVPRSDQPQPVPTVELLDRVSRYLETRRSPLAKLVVTGPHYLRVDVEVEVVPVSIALSISVAHDVRLALQTFLHPLSGGLEGAGWEFGRKPHRSDLFSVLETVPGVDYVSLLNVVETEERTGARDSGRFLVYSGEHRVRLATGLDAGVQSIT
jgi:predicted phage baseplate assembly protein